MKKMKQRLLAGLCSFALIASSIGIEAMAEYSPYDLGYFYVNMREKQYELKDGKAEPFMDVVTSLAGLGYYNNLKPEIGSKLDEKNRDLAYFDLDNKGGMDISVELTSNTLMTTGILFGKETTVEPEYLLASPVPTSSPYSLTCTVKVLDTCSVKGEFLLRPGDVQKKAIQAEEHQYYSEICFKFLDDYNLGTYAMDISSGSCAVKRADYTEKEIEGIDSLLTSILMPSLISEEAEAVILTDWDGNPPKEGEIFVINCDVDKDGTYDMQFLLGDKDDENNEDVTFSKLDTCSVNGTVELKLQTKSIDYFESEYYYYHDKWSIKFSAPAPEPAPTQQETAAEIAPASQIEAAPTEAVISNVTYKVDGESAVLASAPNAKGNFRVPATVKIGDKDFPVNKIAAGAFKGSKITKLTIGNNVTEIGASAAEGCKKLTSVTIGTGLEKIGTKAFFKCGKLKSVTIKSSKVKNVGNKAFKKIKNKATIKVPKKKVSAYKKLFKKAKDSSTTIKKK